MRKGEGEGASSVGADANSSSPGSGGSGTASTITGSSITYAAGGTGGGYFFNTVGSNGSANSGNGGGGSGGGSNNGGNGGSGVVIISLPTGFAATTTGTPTVTINGTNTVYTFTNSGTLIPRTGTPNYSNNFAGGGVLSFTVNSSISFTGDFTVEAWVYMTTYVGGSYNELTVFSPRTASGGSAFDLGNSISGFQGTVDFWDSAVATIARTTDTVPLNQWTHLAWVRYGTGTNNCSIYINGVLKASGTYTGTMGISSGTAYVGNSYYNQQFNNIISNLRVVKGTAVYTSNFTPPTSPLTAISGTSLLTCQSSTFVDNSSNAFILSNSGATITTTSPF